MICPVCHIGTARNHPIFGILPCPKCQSKHKLLQGLSPRVEFTSESIKLQRQAHLEDITPMHNLKGLEKSWLDKYGPKKAKQRGFTDYEIKHATYGFDGMDTYYKKHA